jgi:2-polyprenyl-3-methyl-5-hydroxy-6-metoxy-1,4-benzoquinol methylase
MIYNRALHVDDYNDLAKWHNRLNQLQRLMDNKMAPYRKDHLHREWEYSNVLCQLEELNVEKTDRIMDTGSGGSYLPPVLARLGYAVEVSDSMAYGDFIDTFLIPQCLNLDIRIPVTKCPVEDMSVFEDGTFAVTLCISVIEHVDTTLFEAALRELKRVTKVGGYIFITSDFFRDLAQADASPFRQIQHNLFMPEVMDDLPRKMGGDVSWVGEQPDFSYRGDWVNNYSFVNICLKRDK